MCKQQGGETLPASIENIKTQHLPLKNAASLALIGATAILSAVLLDYLALLTYFRKQAAVKRASFTFSMLIVAGGLLTHGCELRCSFHKTENNR